MTFGKMIQSYRLVSTLKVDFKKFVSTTNLKRFISSFTDLKAVAYSSCYSCVNKMESQSDITKSKPMEAGGNLGSLTPRKPPGFALNKQLGDSSKEIQTTLTHRISNFTERNQQGNVDLCEQGTSKCSILPSKMKRSETNLRTHEKETALDCVSENINKQEKVDLSNEENVTTECSTENSDTVVNVIADTLARSQENSSNKNCNYQNQLSSDSTTTSGNSKPPLFTKKGVLPKNLLQKVSNIVHEKYESNPSALLSEDTANTCKTEEQCETDLNRSSLETLCDGSALFSGKYDEAFQQYEENCQKRSSKKRKHENVKTSELCSHDQVGKKRKKTPPNYFLSVQVDNALVHKNLETVQKHILMLNRELKRAVVPVATLHLTLMVMHLADDGEIQKAVNALNKCQTCLSQLLREPLVLEISGINHFREQVIFASTDNTERLQHISDAVTEVFAEEGIASSDEKGFKPHITILKLSKAPKLRRKGIKKVGASHYKPYRESTFGRQLVKGVQLCAMLKPKQENGYYYVEQETTVEYDQSNDRIRNLDDGISLLSVETPQPHHQPLNFIVEFQKEINWNFTKPDDERSQNSSND